MSRYLYMICILLQTFMAFSQGWNIFFDSKSGKAGLNDETGNILLPCEYSTMYPMDSHYVLVKLNDLVGMANRKGEFVIPLEYNYIQKVQTTQSSVLSEEKAYYLVSKQGGQGLYSIGEGEVLPCMYSSIGLFKVQDDVFQILRPSYTYCVIYSPLQWILVQSGGKWGIAGKGNNFNVNYLFDTVTVIYKDACIARINGKWGVWSLSGNKEMIPFKYDTLLSGIFCTPDYKHYTFHAKNNKQSIVVNSAGEEFPVPPNEFSDFNLISSALGFFRDEGGEKMILFDYRAGKSIITDYLTVMAYAMNYNHTVFVSFTDFTYVVADGSGKEVYRSKIPMVDNYGEIALIGKSYFFDGNFICQISSNGVEKKYEAIAGSIEISDIINMVPFGIIVKQNGKYGLLLRTKDTLKELLPCTYSKITYPVEYYDWYRFPFIVYQGKAAGMVKMSEDSLKWVLPLEFESVESYDHPYYYVKKNGKYGVCNTDQGLVCPCVFSKKEDIDFSGGFKVLEGNLFLANYCIYDMKGYEATLTYRILKSDQFGMENIVQYSPYYLIVSQKGKFGIVTKQGNTIQELLPCTYDKITYPYENANPQGYPFFIETGGKKGMARIEEGQLKWVVDVEYEKIEQYDDLDYIIVKDKKYGVCELNKGIVVPCTYNSKEEAIKEYQKMQNQ